MSIPESQLETWSHQGAVTTARNTHESIRRALDAYAWPRTLNYEVYLQGSYRNSTNIRGDSDVDLVVQLNSTWERDLSRLSEPEKTLYFSYYSRATYHWSDFRADVLKALRDYYGAGVVSEGNKALKVAPDSNRLAADVVVGLQYRKYRRFLSSSDQDFEEGIVFYTRRENRKVINYPKLHYQNGVAKNADERTLGWYKPTVRMIKNARTYLADHGFIRDDLAPSYFLECLIYNVADGQFGGSYQAAFYDVIEWLNGVDMSRFVCQNEQLYLFGNTPEQWSIGNAQAIVGELLDLWSNW